ncbi:small integral membrane protein 4 [Cephus cinctus]|uniref:Small integral membrane protein 4 n=1 Tax=Cephus cinctus TaxID=211228 RepID=A0AAJ7BNF0_CEPCN|nr:small integral membrane protein 4 [Cephus cinctus]
MCSYLYHVRRRTNSIWPPACHTVGEIKYFYSYQMFLYSSRLKKLLKKWPGKKLLGEYRFLPIFFVAGAALEFSMIKWKVGEVNFYNTYKRRQVETIVNNKLEKEKLAAPHITKD